MKKKPSPKKGKFITFEGVDRSGKTTQVDLARHFLFAHSISVISTREPGGTKIGEKLRSLLLCEENLLPMSELLIINAARIQHIETLILPELDKGNWIICDRFVDSTYAYQCGGRGLQRTAVQQIMSLVVGPLVPDLTIMLDIDFDAFTAREQGADHRRRDKFEKEGKNFFLNVRREFLRIANENHQRVVQISTDGLSIERVHARIVQALREDFFPDFFSKIYKSHI